MKRLFVAVCIALALSGCSARKAPSPARHATAQVRPPVPLVLTGEVDPPNPDDRTFDGWGRVRMVAEDGVRVFPLSLDWTFRIPDAPRGRVTLVVEGRQRSQLSGMNPWFSFIGVRHLKPADLRQQPIAISTRRPWTLGVAVSYPGTAETGNDIRRSIEIFATPLWSDGVLHADLVSDNVDGTRALFAFQGWPDIWIFSADGVLPSGQRVRGQRTVEIREEPTEFIVIQLAHYESD